MAACSLTPSAAGAQEPSTPATETTVVLDTTVAEATTPSTFEAEAEGEGVQTVTADQSSGVETDTVAAENRRLLLIVAGLVAVALALALLTVRYWRITRPVPVEVVEPARPRRRAAEQADPEPSDEVFIDDDEPVIRPATRSGRRSRRAIAGADHEGADDTWEPRATGEHERVQAPESLSKARPSRIDRRRALGSPED